MSFERESRGSKTQKIHILPFFVISLKNREPQLIISQ